MTRLKMGMLAAAAMLLATSAQAASGTLEFEGFSITYSSLGQWDQVHRGDEKYTLLDNREYDLSGNSKRISGGMAEDHGTAQFYTSTAPIVQSKDGLGNAVFQSTFTYTVQVKEGWQLNQLMTGVYQAGTFSEANGGTISVSSNGSGSATGGANSTRGGPSIYNRDVSSSGRSGDWSTSFTQHAWGNRHDQVYEPVYDSNGNKTGFTLKWAIFDDAAGPLTGVTGTFTQTLSASTTGASQSAYLAGDAPTFYISGYAFKSVSAVPEPDTYAMMAASLGLIGFAARRKSKKSA